MDLSQLLGCLYKGLRICQRCLVVTCGRCVPEKCLVIAVKGGIISETAALANRSRLFACLQHFLCGEQSLFQNVFLGRLVQLLLE